MSHQVLRGAQVVDGTRAPARRVDVEIDNGMIVRVGEIPPIDEAEDVDLTGLVLAPGFIDAHTHFDAQIFWDADFTPSSWHGVTTVVMGNCGFGLAPAKPGDQDLMMQTLEHVEGMNLAALRAGIDWCFETMPEFLQVVERRPKRLNVATMLGHTPLRFYVMGREADEREATDAEIDRMCQLLIEALQAGAIGFSTSQAPSHIGPSGNPVASRMASREEIKRLLVAMGSTGKGIAELTYGPQYQIDEVAKLSKELGVRITWGSLLTSLFGGPGAALELLEKGAAVGGDIWPQVSCRLIINVQSFAEPNHFNLLPSFKEVWSVPREQRAAVYADPEWRARALAEMPGLRPMWWDQAWVRESEMFPELVGHSLEDIAAERNVHPWDAMLDIALAENLDTRFAIVGRNGDREELAALLTDPRTILGAHDAGAHVDMLCDSVFPTYFLAHWVRDQQAMSIEDAVWRLSGQIAEVFGIAGRGVIAEGNAADLVAFDPETVEALELERVRDFPAGADRLIGRSVGIEHVWVNGTAIRSDGKDVAGVTPGVAVR